MLTNNTFYASMYQIVEIKFSLLGLQISGGMLRFFLLVSKYRIQYYL